MDTTVPGAVPEVVSMPEASGEQKLPKAKVLFKEAKAIYKKNWKALATVIAVVAVPYVLITVGLGAPYLKEHALVAGILQLAYGVAMIFASAAMLKGAIDAEKGEAVTFESAYKRGTIRAGAYLATSLLFALAMIGGFILVIIPGFIFGVWYCMSTIITVDQGLSPVASMKKSRAYVKGNFWPVVGRALYSVGWTILLYIGVGIVAAIFVIAFRGNTAMAQIVSAVVQIFWSPLLIIYQFLVYRELKRMYDTKAVA